MAKRRPVIGVMGSGAGTLPREVLQQARELGAGIARRGWVLLTGGRGGIMAAASQGAAEAGGLVLGILPGRTARDVNPYVQVAVITGLNDARNYVNVLSAQVVVAFPGNGGTLSEIGMALKNGIPVVDLGGWRLANSLFDPGARLHPAAHPEEALELLERLLLNLPSREYP